MLLLEAALFSAGKAVDATELSNTTGIEPAMVQLYLKKLIQSYTTRPTAIEVAKAGTKYVLRLKDEFVDRVRTLASPEVSSKLLKTAALIAYHQPVKQSMLVEMYGVKVYDHVQELISLGLVRARKEGPTKVLSTTHRFSEVFGIDSVTKNKVKGHVKEKALERIRTVAKATLESFEDGKEAATDASRSAGPSGPDQVQSTSSDEPKTSGGGVEGHHEEEGDQKVEQV